MSNMEKIQIFFTIPTQWLILWVSFLHNNFKEKTCDVVVESFFQLKGLEFNPFPNCFCQQMKWMKKNIEHLNKFEKLIALKKQPPRRKED